MFSWHTAGELIGMPGMPGTAQGVRKLAAREGWEGQRRLGSKAIEYSFSVLPAETQAAVLAQMVGDEQKRDAKTELIPVQRDAISPSRFTEKQRNVMDARLAFVREIERMTGITSQQRAIMTLVELAQKSGLPAFLNDCLSLANNRKTENRTLSERTLKRWLADYRKHGVAALAPAKVQKDKSVPVWAPVFLKHYQRPQKPSVVAAYEAFSAEYPGCPSIHVVRRFLDRLSPEAREFGRMSPQALKALKAFRKLKTDHLEPNDIWVADGHTFDAEVINPLTGQPFRPEVTILADWATRRIVGFAVNLAESALATLDALRYSVARCGMYRTLYVDNGKGFKNAGVYGASDRLGGSIVHSLPYNSQARGVIERAHKTILVRLAKTFETYIGADMDKEAGTRIHKLTRKQLESGIEAGRLIPTLNEFCQQLDEALDAYNLRPHTGLEKVRDYETGLFRHLSPLEAWKAAEAKGWEATTVDAPLLESLIRPQVTRKTSRGTVKIFGNSYFSDELVALHGEDIQVAYDYRDASQVWAFTMQGELICTAGFEANARRVEPRPKIDQDKERRVGQQIKRSQKKIKTITGHDVDIQLISSTAPAGPSQEQIEEGRQFVQQQIAAQPSFEIPRDAMARYRKWQELDARLRATGALSEEEANWHHIYPNHPDFNSIKRMYATFGAAHA